MNNSLTIFDILLPPFYILAAIAYGYWVTKKNIRTNPEYEYFTRGLIVRIFGAIGLGLIYFFITEAVIQLTIIKVPVLMQIYSLKTKVTFGPLGWVTQKVTILHLMNLQAIQFMGEEIVMPILLLDYSSPL
ncbi:MAG: hypothetical protein IPL10_07590 [Bacteroidetes bacterium]|nr:hypothetical protein [Bacteroidota bacterium]